MQTERPRHKTGTAQRTVCGILLATVLALCGFARTSAAAVALPDGRAYELVSPADKNSGAAGGQGRAAAESPLYSLARADGNALFSQNTIAPFPSAVGGEIGDFVATRSPTRWETHSALPRAHGEPGLSDQPTTLLPAVDFSHFLFADSESFVAGDPATNSESGSVYLDGEDPIVEPEWVGEPVPRYHPEPSLGEVRESPVLSGGSSDLSRIYFAYYGTLVPEDATRALVHKEGKVSTGGPWGFYEWSKTAGLRSAGVLPEGAPSPLGALPAATVGKTPMSEFLNNQVAEEPAARVLRALFVSPDPEFCQGNPVCVGHPTELYMREASAGGEAHSFLLSRDQEGKPAVDGPLAVPPAEERRAGAPSPYVFASADGSQVFFQSIDALAPGATANALPKQYDYDVNTRRLTYLPGVAGTASLGGNGPPEDASVILAASTNGQRFIYAKRENAALVSLDLWERLPGGELRTIVVSQLPRPAELPAVRATADGSVFVFETNSPLPDAVNAEGSGPASNGGGFEQVYRYDVASGSLLCVSCAPAGVPPSGNARLSEDDNQPSTSGPGDDNGVGDGELAGSRGLSDDGSRVFFDTPEALVPQDVNGRRDVYEWENSQIYLISSGTNSNESFFLDNSESGGDVFFATTAGLVPRDTDGSYDIYDARAAHEPGETVGFPTQSLPAPCTEDCQPVLSLPSLAFFGGTESVSGMGNVTATTSGVPGGHKPKRKTVKRTKTKRRARRRATSRNAHDNRGRGRASSAPTPKT